MLALWVVLGHLLQQSGVRALIPPELSLVGDANIPVGVFIVISGFVITHLIVNRREPYLPYITRRFFRLAPLLWACLAFILAYSVAFPAVFRWDKSHTPEYLAGYMSMLHGIPPEEILRDSARSILPPAWSTSLEWQFYLVAPLLLWKRSWLVIVLAAIAALLLTKKNLFAWFGLTFDAAFLPTMLLYFLIGIGSYFAVTAMTNTRVTLLAGIAAAIAVYAISRGDHVLVIWTLMLATLLGAKPARWVLESKPLVWLGGISYSIYLTHMIVLMPVRKQVVEQVLGIPFGTWSHFAASAVITVPTVILVSWLTWMLIERPGQRLGLILARMMRKRDASLPAAALAPAPAE